MANMMTNEIIIELTDNAKDNMLLELLAAMPWDNDKPERLCFLGKDILMRRAVVGTALKSRTSSLTAEESKLNA
jgi:hypothetical protein